MYYNYSKKILDSSLWLLLLSLVIPNDIIISRNELSQVKEGWVRKWSWSIGIVNTFEKDG